MKRQRILKNFGIVAVTYLGFVYWYDKYIFESVLLLDSIVGSQIELRNNLDYEKAYDLKKALPKDGENDDAGKKIILVWTRFFRRVFLQPFLCDGCIITHDESAVEKADAIVFHCVETRDYSSWLPLKHRNPEQRWVWACAEPPWNVRYVFQKTLTPLNGIFNWTMTYRTDSDIFLSYMYEIPQLDKTVSEIIQDKTASALGAWIVSNCHVSRRSQLITELSKYIDIDIFGKCSGRSLCRGDCERDVLYRYKFYFALENSQCKDYITEKFWYNGLYSHSVPVVLGPSRHDYEIVAPPNSFIHVDDFDSIESLAKYLIKLDKDDKLYGDYLRWMSSKENGVAKTWQKDVSRLKPKDSYAGLIEYKTTSVADYCSLCNKLNKPLPPKVINKLDEWWFGKNYSIYSEKFSVCLPQSGQSGYPRRWQVTLGYNLFFIFVFVICLYFCLKERASLCYS